MVIIYIFYLYNHTFREPTDEIKSRLGNLFVRTPVFRAASRVLFLIEEIKAHVFLFLFDNFFLLRLATAVATAAAAAAAAATTTTTATAGRHRRELLVTFRDQSGDVFTFDFGHEAGELGVVNFRRRGGQNRLDVRGRRRFLTGELRL